MSVSHESPFFSARNALPGTFRFGLCYSLCLSLPMFGDFADERVGKVVTDTDFRHRFSS